jgi:hypothetical protein
MTYPIFNLSYPVWEEELIQEFIRHDDLYYSNDEEFFRKYFLNQTFIDCDGQLYKLNKAEDYTVRKFLFFKSHRKKLYFKSLNERLSYREFISELKKRADTLTLESVKKEFFKLIKTCNSIEALLNKI